MSDDGHRCGYITLVGRPNVGKSTLVNAIIGSKVSIVSSKPQTTRFRILAIHSTIDAQFIYVDIPGLNYNTKRAINRHMNRIIGSAIAETDVIVLVVEAGHWTHGDDKALNLCIKSGRPLVLAINKIDNVKPRTRILSFIDEIKDKTEFNSIVPVSARTKENIKELEKVIKPLLPPSPVLFPDGQQAVYDAQMRAAECIREKLMKFLEQEVPYSTAVRVHECRQVDGVLHIQAVIWVEREGQKAIVIGRNGGMLKQIGQAARLELEHENDCKVFVRLHVKVREQWPDNEGDLKSLGILHGK